LPSAVARVIRALPRTFQMRQASMGYARCRDLPADPQQTSTTMGLDGVGRPLAN